MPLKDLVTQSTLSLKGETPAVRPGAEAINDLHFVGGNHVHSDANKPMTQLGTAAGTLQGSKFNQTTPYANPEVQ